MADPLQTTTDKKISPGLFYPLGATLSPGGVNFALYSQNAREVFLLLFDHPDAVVPTDVIRLENRTKYVWHVFVRDLGAGQLYGYKVRGDFRPREGLRFNEHKLLIDPYAKALAGKCRNTDNLLLGYDPNSPDRDLSVDTRDSTPVVPKSVVVDDAFDWQGDAPLLYPLEDLTLYEVHLKGFTAHPSSGVKHPGTYLGFIEKIPYLKQLGINAVEFLPLHEFYVDDFLLNKKLTNYWGYNTLGFFTPESSYGTQAFPGCQVTEFKQLVRALHQAGIEVILDVVFNHTAEGNELGATLGFRGIDNPTYYVLTGPEDQPGRYYMNYTGCGNSVQVSNHHVIRFILDSLRYWVEVMHVDGFRFDLASVLGREGWGFTPTSGFFDAVSADPVLNRVKLIAEPWDLGTYQVGNFPLDWSEWNGKFRDTVRKFVKGDAGQVPDLAGRLTGSADLYGDDGRSAYNSINFITCHDGFTLHDLVAYNDKHNGANLENNQDGTNDNHAWNCGWEGESADPHVLALRRQQAKNFMCLLLFSAGTPMLLGGDEFLRTQNGNNNAYCQDNPLSWFDWNRVKQNQDFVDFCRKAIALTRRYSVLQSRKFLDGLDHDGNGLPAVSWFGLNGAVPQWDNPETRILSYRLDGSDDPSSAGKFQLFIIFNADYRAQGVSLPVLNGQQWFRLIDTSLEPGKDLAEDGQEVVITPATHYVANGRSTVVLLGR
ncbi:MAG: glycogen debranching protein GlgX [Candidatus Firestonebacteria bacterium]|nr:glycogen debranching protein GlgX [Candidatus Firestonebacteria bacterium]